MKVLILNTSDLDGGAARAAYRLHQGLQKTGVSSQMLVQNKQSNDETIIAPLTNLEKGIAKLKPTLDSLPLQLYRDREHANYSLQWFPDKIAAKVAQFKPDLINLHWINFGFIQIESIAKFKQPIIWTLHDMWAFTGGCHYSQNCDRYNKSCGKCPQLHSDKDWDLSQWVWQRKAKAWNKLNLTIVTPSYWLAKCVKASSLFQNIRIETIPNGLDTQRYKLLDKQLAKNLLGLPPTKQLILFGAIKPTSDPRKGFHLLLPALQKLSQISSPDRIELAIFGEAQPRQIPDFGFKTHYLGRLHDDISLSLVFAAADVLVAPSLQDNLPNVVMEALACGTPCIAFNIGGLPDLIEHEQNGYLACPFDAEDLAKGVNWILADQARHKNLIRRAREKVEQEFTLELQTKRYLSLFKEISKINN